MASKRMLGVVAAAILLAGATAATVGYHQPAQATHNGESQASDSNDYGKDWAGAIGVIEGVSLTDSVLCQVVLIDSQVFGDVCTIQSSVGASGPSGGGDNGGAAPSAGSAASNAHAEAHAVAEQTVIQQTFVSFGGGPNGGGGAAQAAGSSHNGTHESHGHYHEHHNQNQSQTGSEQNQNQYQDNGGNEETAQECENDADAALVNAQVCNVDATLVDDTTVNDAVDAVGNDVANGNEVLNTTEVLDEGDILSEDEVTTTVEDSGTIDPIAP